MNDAPTPCCTKCHAHLWDTELAAGRWACGRCEHTAFEQLRALPALFKSLDQLSALMKGSSTGQVGGTREIPAPLKLGILSLIAKGGVVTELQIIEDDWRKALGWSMGATRHHADIDGATTFLINQLGWACSNYGEVDTDLRSIAHLHAQLDGITKGEPGPRRFTVYCGVADCGGAMNITMIVERSRCPDCGETYRRDQLMQLDSEYGPNTIREQEAAA